MLLALERELKAFADRQHCTLLFSTTLLPLPQTGTAAACFQLKSPSLVLRCPDELPTALKAPLCFPLPLHSLVFLRPVPNEQRFHPHSLAGV